jgi:hypothetical protein
MEAWIWASDPKIWAWRLGLNLLTCSSAFPHLHASVICRISRDMAGRAAAVGIILVDQVFFLYLRPMAALPNPVAR